MPFGIYSHLLYITTNIPSKAKDISKECRTSLTNGPDTHAHKAPAPIELAQINAIFPRFGRSL